MNSHNFAISPLRYPGGKSKISPFLEDIILLNNLDGATIYELYAGGAGASINLLSTGISKKIVLNDLDIHIYAFWYSLLNETDLFIKSIIDTDVNLENWRKQQDIYNNFEDFSLSEVGFSTFFLNRTNRSGILHKAGPIGGLQQTGNYKIDVRFNKNALISRIEKIARLRDQIEIYNFESISFLKEIFKKDDRKLIFLDPPYYNQGENLYLNFYKDSDHKELSKLLLANKNESWVLTYDNTDRINEFYSCLRRSLLDMSYTLQTKRKAKEVIVFSEDIYLPKQIRLGNKSMPLNFVGYQDGK